MISRNVQRLYRLPISRIGQETVDLLKRMNKNECSGAILSTTSSKNMADFNQTDESDGIRDNAGSIPLPDVPIIKKVDSDLDGIVAEIQLA